MRLKPDLPASPYAPLRGNGPESIPYTGGNANDPHHAKPASAAFFTKAQLLGAASLDYARGKLFLGRLDQKMIGIADGRHIVTLAGSGGGKSVCSLIPNLMLYEGSTLVLDPKGELAAATARHRAEKLGQRVLVLDPWAASGESTKPYRLDDNGNPLGFNPLEELAKGDPDNLIDDADMIADALIIPAKGEAHWTDSARALVRALILWLVLSDDDERGGPLSIALLPTLIAKLAETVRAQDEKGGTDKPKTSLLDVLAGFDLGGACPEVQSVINNQGQMMLGTSPKERASILSTARTQLAFLESPQLGRALAKSMLGLPDLKREACTVYLCLPASRMGTHSRWLRLIVNLAIAAMEREPTKPPLPVLFMLEEFAALGHMRALENAVAYMRGFGVKLWAVLQDLGQLKQHYKESWETFLGNAGVLQAFSVNDDTTSSYLSKRLGQTTIVITNKESVGSHGAASGDTGERRQFQSHALLSPDEIGIAFAHKVAPEGHALGGMSLVLWSGKAPMMVERVFYGELVQ